MRITDKDDPVFQVFEEVLTKKNKEIEGLKYEIETYKEIIAVLTRRLKDAEGN